MPSVGAVAAGIIIIKTGWYRADPLVSVFICCGIVIFSIWLVRDSVHILMEGAPVHLDLIEVRRALKGLPGVREVHDLHLWSVSKGAESMSGHLVIETGHDTAPVLKAGTKLLKSRFHFSHVTLQIEDLNLNAENKCEEYE